MERLSEYLIEAVAKRSTEKYKELTIDDLKPGMRVKIKDSLDGCKNVSYAAIGNISDNPIVGGIVINDRMQELLGEVVTVDRLRKPVMSVYVKENPWAWPVEIFETP